jgi:hypothetical protein
MKMCGQPHAPAALPQEERPASTHYNYTEPVMAPGQVDIL